MLKAMAGYTKTNPSMIPLYSRRILTATSQLYCGRMILDQALLAERRAQEVGPEHYDYKFYTGKVATARYYLRNVVPNVWSTAEIVIDGDTSAIDVPVEVFEY
jgi:3-(methylthio)propanoyl-CoA dehydrogenase